jgi:hypothetical protein
MVFCYNFFLRIGWKRGTKDGKDGKDGKDRKDGKAFHNGYGIIF